MTIRDGEDQGICSAVLKELLKIDNDQIEERSVVVTVFNKESAIWKDANMKRCYEMISRNKSTLKE